MVVEILDAGAGINAVSKSGTALCLAALKSRASVVKLLLERRAKAGISTRLGTAFHCAAYAGSLQCLELLLATNADPNVETQVDIQLLESIFYDNSDSTPPSRGLKNIETIKECSPSTLAMWKGINSIEIINLLGAQVQSTNTLCKVKFIGKDYQCEHTSLMIAANCGHTLLLEHLLQTLKTSCPQHVFHEFVNRMDQHGPTALILAAVNGDTTMVRLLCESGADAGLADATGTSPLWWAAEFKYQDCARILLNFGALVDARNRYGITPLIIAIRGESQEMVQLLLEAGADASDTSFDLIKNEGVRQKAKLQFALTYASRFAEHTESA